jgi:PAS domain S-box-containing protein
VQVRQDLSHLLAISRLADAAARAVDPEPIHREALDLLIGTVGADRAAILFFDADGVMRFTAWRGLSDDYRAAVEGHSPWQRDTPDPQPVLVPDVADEPTLAPLLEILGAEGIAAVAFVPLVSGGKLLGKFMLYFDEPHLFSTDEVEVARTAAAQVAFALDKQALEAELRTANAALAATLDAVTDGITVQAPDGRLLFANDEAAVILGFGSPVELLGAGLAAIMERFQILDDDGAPLDASRLPGRRALQGEDAPEQLVRYRVQGVAGDRWSLVSARPVFDDEGRVRFAVNVFRDITDRQRAIQAVHESERRVAFLSSTSRRLLDTPLDYATTLARVAALFVPDLADAAAVREFAVEGAATAPRAVVRHAGGLGAEEARRLLASPAALTVPLLARDRALGEVALARRHTGYDPSDRALAEEVARRAGLALEHARMYEERATVASTLQRALLPPGLPEIPGLELAARYSAAASDIGGDFYDVVQTGPHRWMLAVGDVCGKGIEAASLTAMVRYTVRAFAADAPSPSALLARVNAALLPQLNPERFCTLACAFLDLAPPPTVTPPTLTLSLGGHPRPLLVPAAGGVRPVGRPGSLLGALAAPDLYDETVGLGPGDALVVFTDGCVGDDPAGAERRLGAALEEEAGAGAGRLAEAVEAAALAAVDHTDDLTVLSCRRL